jgi:bifunctional DNase/RNase
MNKIELEIVALSHSVTQSHNYAVVLGEINGTRRLPIVIGGFEAQAIAVAMENMTPNRPLTHDLFKNTLDIFDITLKEILVNNLQDGIFYAQLICESNGKLVKIDSRTSDAIAMAVRYECPIFTLDFIMEEAGVILEESESRPSRRKKKKVTDPEDLTSYTKKDLKSLLDDVLAKEDYEQAAKIRDELNKRSTDQQ